MKHLFLYLIAGLMLTACSANQGAAPGSPEFHFQQGEVFMEKGLYNDAVTSWEKVRDSFYSPELTMLAELKLAETYYLDERYPEAASAYNDFLRQYPGDDRNGSVTYRLAMSYYRQILSIDRDQTSTENALRAFNDLLRLYPKEKDENEIRPLIQHCLDHLAAHEVYVGRFYLRTKFYQSTIKRLERALREYPDYRHLDEAYFYLLSAYLKQENPEKAEDVFQQMLEAFPNSPYIEKAQKELKK